MSYFLTAAGGWLGWLHVLIQKGSGRIHRNGCPLVTCRIRRQSSASSRSASQPTDIKGYALTNHTGCDKATKPTHTRPSPVGHNMRHKHICQTRQGLPIITVRDLPRTKPGLGTRKRPSCGARQGPLS